MFNKGIDNILATSARALALEADLAEAHASRGLAQTWVLAPPGVYTAGRQVGGSAC